MTLPRLPLPPALAELRILAGSEEIASSLRHRTISDVTRIGATLMTLRRRLTERHPAAARDPAIRALLETLDDRVVAVGESLPNRSLPPPAEDAPPVPIRRVLAPLVDAMTSSLRPGDRFEVRFDDELARARIDPGELALAVGCLLENALDALPAGRAGSVVLACRWDPAGDRETVLAVVDDGEAIADGVFDRLFDPFFTTRPDRLGLGLKIARRLARRWGGEVMMAAEVPAGTRAELTLPGVSPPSAGR